jgi:hypothetical protein
MIARLNKKHYPMSFTFSASGVPRASGFIHRIDGKPVTYSKRMYAAGFIESYNGGRATWAEIDGIEGAKVDDQERRQFLADTVDDSEYSARLEHIHTPRASEY